MRTLMIRSTAMLILLGATAGCSGETGSPASAPAPTTEAPAASPFEAVYEQAALEFEVPVEVLRAIAFAQTAHHEVSGADHSGQYGVMGLHREVAMEAAGRLGVEVEVVLSDRLSNVRAAAAIVAARRAEGATWNAAALAVADLDHASLRAHWLLKFARDLRRHGSMIAERIEEPAAGYASFAPMDYPNANWVPANTGNYSNYSRGLNDIDKVIIHDVEGSYEGCISWFQNPAANVSAHYVIANEGYVTQMVREEDVAWHAGNWDYNERAVGIEHEGYASDPNSYPEPMYAASAQLVAYLCDKYSIPCNRTTVISHKEVPGATHTDPGPYWKWDHFMELVQQGGGPSTATLVGYVRVDDIMEGAPIAGATVTLDDGRTTVTDAEGYYEFAELDFRLWTVTATAEGYEQAVDSKEVDTAQTYWKSMALTASAAPTDPVDPADPVQSSAKRGGCSVASTGSAATGAVLPFLLLGLAVVVRRRR